MVRTFFCQIHVLFFNFSIAFQKIKSTSSLYKTQVILTFMVNHVTSLEYFIEESDSSICSAYDDFCFAVTLTMPFIIPIALLLIYLMSHFCYIKCYKKSSKKFEINEFEIWSSARVTTEPKRTGPKTGPKVAQNSTKCRVYTLAISSISIISIDSHFRRFWISLIRFVIDLRPKWRNSFASVQFCRGICKCYRNVTWFL